MDNREGGERLVPTHCSYCGVRCGMYLRVSGDGRVFGVEPRDHPINRLKLCPKGVTAYQQLDHPDRLLHPLVRDGKGGPLRRASWNGALIRVVAEGAPVQVRPLLRPHLPGTGPHVRHRLPHRRHLLHGSYADLLAARPHSRAVDAFMFGDSVVHTGAAVVVPVAAGDRPAPEGGDEHSLSGGSPVRRHGVGEAVRKRITERLGRRQAVAFAYPTGDDRALAVRLDDGTLVASSSACTHLACGVLYRPEEGDIYCPCHEGRFDPRTGEPVAGPPTRALPPVRLDERPDGIWAVGAGP